MVTSIFGRMEKHDVVIVGAGPVGIETAVALKQAGVPYRHIEAAQIGRTMTMWPPQTRWFSSTERIQIAGVPIQSSSQSKCFREEYLAYLRSIVMQFDLDIRTYEPVLDITRDGGVSVLTTRPMSGPARQYRADKLVLATGGNARHRRLGIPGEKLPHVHHVLAEPHLYFGRRVTIVGGRNSAAEAALRCHHAGARVVWCYRGDQLPPGVKYWLRPELEHLVETGRIEAHLRTVPVEITPQQVTLQPVDGGEPVDIESDFVLVLIGYDADMTLFEMAGVTLEGDRRVPVFDEQTMETDAPGVYVAGTATAGTQHSGVNVFLENCHVHAARIVAALTGGEPPPAPDPYGLEES
jgi:thioredoxin reductase (NADPH)